MPWDVIFTIVAGLSSPALPQTPPTVMAADPCVYTSEDLAAAESAVAQREPRAVAEDSVPQATPSSFTRPRVRGAISPVSIRSVVLREARTGFSKAASPGYRPGAGIRIVSPESPDTSESLDSLGVSRQEGACAPFIGAPAHLEARVSTNRHAVGLCSAPTLMSADLPVSHVALHAAKSPFGMRAGRSAVPPSHHQWDGVGSRPASVIGSTTGRNQMSSVSYLSAPSWLQGAGLREGVAPGMAATCPELSGYDDSRAPTHFQVARRADSRIMAGLSSSSPCRAGATARWYGSQVVLWPGQIRESASCWERCAS